MNVESIMTTSVSSVLPEMIVKDVVSLLTEKKISGAPVVDSKGTLISVISEGDLLKLAASGSLLKTVGSCLSQLTPTAALKTVKKTDKAADAYKLFLAHRVHRLLVVDSNGKLIGILSRSNILRFIVSDTKADAA